jgi:hypothetical protein
LTHKADGIVDRRLTIPVHLKTIKLLSAASFKKQKSITNLYQKNQTIKPLNGHQNLILHGELPKIDINCSKIAQAPSFDKAPT